MHIVINNQVGFTTSAADDARSTLYCTDVAKMVGAPVLHVNGDDPEAVVFCAELAFDFRQRFEQGRRHRPGLLPPPRPQRGRRAGGDAAADVPEHPRDARPRASCTPTRWPRDGVIAAADAKALVDALPRQARRGRSHHRTRASVKADEFTVDWTPYLDGKLVRPGRHRRCRATTLDALATQINTHARTPSSCIRAWRRSTKTAARWPPASCRCDWGFAENLAYATLLDRRLSSCAWSARTAGRGTFFHRHAVLHDQNTDDALPAAARTGAGHASTSTIIDSLLSEEAVMAFEYGYSTADPMTLEHLGRRSSAISPTARRW